MIVKHMCIFLLTFPSVGVKITNNCTDALLDYFLMEMIWIAKGLIHMSLTPPSGNPCDFIVGTWVCQGKPNELKIVKLCKTAQYIEICSSWRICRTVLQSSLSLRLLCISCVFIILLIRIISPMNGNS